MRTSGVYNSLLFETSAFKSPGKMSKQESLEKVRNTFVKLKEDIDGAEDRYYESKNAKLESDNRLEKAEEEQESYRRRIKLLEVELEKTKKTLGEKEDRLAHLEGRTEDDDEKRREFEGIEIERDDQLIAMEEEALSAKQQAHEASHILMETQRKLLVVEGDFEKACQRCDAAVDKEQLFLDLIERNGEELRTLEDRDNQAAEREFDAEEKLRFLEEQLKEAVARAEGAERDVVRNENIVISVKNDLHGCKDKRVNVEKEIDRIEELVDGLGNSFEPIDDVQEPEPEQEED
mgnify:FL=1